MANVLNGNSFYVDTAYSTSADDLVRASVLVSYVIVTTTAANGVVLAGDVAGTSPSKLSLKLAANTSSQIFDFSRRPILFPNGIRVTTLTNCVVTFVLSNQGG